MQWGKDRPPTGQFDGFSPAQAQSAYPQSPATFFPQYGQPGPMSPQCKFVRLMLTARITDISQLRLHSANSSNRKPLASSRKLQAYTQLPVAGHLKAACRQALVATVNLVLLKASPQWARWVSRKASLSVAAMVATRARSLMVSIVLSRPDLATTGPSL